MSYPPPYFLFDVGATKSRFAASHDGVHFDEPEVVITPKTFPEGIELIVTMARKLAGEHIGAVAGGIPGPLNSEKTRVINAPNLPDWNEKPLKDMIAQRLSAPVLLENDTALVGLGEAVAGSGVDYGIVAYLTISTGVNGVRIVDKKIDKSAMGFEIGHMILDVNHANYPGDFESMVSGDALHKRYSISPKDISDSRIWEEETRLVAAGIHNIICFWSPEVVIVGGAVSQKLQSELISKYLGTTLTIYKHIPQVKMSSLTSFGGIHGALHFIKSA